MQTPPRSWGAPPRPNTWILTASITQLLSWNLYCVQCPACARCTWSMEHKGNQAQNGSHRKTTRARDICHTAPSPHAPPPNALRHLPREVVLGEAPGRRSCFVECIWDTLLTQLLMEGHHAGGQRGTMACSETKGPTHGFASLCHESCLLPAINIPRTALCIAHLGTLR